MQDKDPIDIYLREQKIYNYPISNLIHTVTTHQLQKLIREYPEWLATYYVDPKNDNTKSLHQSGNKQLPEQDGTP